MPVTPTYPGVYIEEVSSGVHTITGVSTSVAAFIDYFARGPMNKAVQIFSMGDFEREFGGLDINSEASYAVQQFFLNGGTEAWVVRAAASATTTLTGNITAAVTTLPVADTSSFASAGSLAIGSETMLYTGKTATSFTGVTRGARGTTAAVHTSGDEVDQAFAAASINLLDSASGGTLVFTATAGKVVQGSSVDNPGVWGNNLRIDIDYNTTDPASLFNLTVTEYATVGGVTSPVRSETFRNLSMSTSSPLYAVSVVNDGSKLIQLTQGTSSNRPAQTGTSGSVALTPTVVTGTDPTHTVNVSVNGVLAGAINLGTPAVTTASQLRDRLQSRLAAITNGSGAFVMPNATVELIGTMLHIRSGGNPSDVLTFVDLVGDLAADLGLAAAGANVQQYSLGNTSAAGAMSGGVPGTNGLPPGAAELRGSRLTKTGLYALEGVDLFNILCIPRTASLAATDATGANAVISEALAYCNERRAFMIVDIPAAINEVQEMKDWMDANATLRNKNAAVYFPRVDIADPLNNFRLRSVGPSGTMAGVYARTDSSRGVWKAPAGIEAVLQGVQALDTKLTDPENGTLNPLGINCLRSFPVYGNVSWGARTLQGADVQASEWKYIPVRRLALYLEESLFRGTKWVVFEPNDEPLWAQIRLNVGAFMHNLFRQGAFQGTTPREAYLVKCDKETTTQNDIDLGIVNILVGFAPLKPAEFVIIKIQQLAGQIET